MKQWLTIVLGAGIAMTGCGRAPEPTAAPAPAEQAALSVDEELARYCRVCVVDSGVKHEEYLPTRLDQQRDGKTYRFCKDDCRAKFDAAPERYLVE